MVLGCQLDLCDMKKLTVLSSDPMVVHTGKVKPRLSYTLVSLPVKLSIRCIGPANFSRWPVSTTQFRAAQYLVLTYWLDQAFQ